MNRISGLVIVLCSALATSARAGDFSTVTFSDDISSGINTSVTYSLKVDLTGSKITPTIVNGVTLDVGRKTGTNYATTGDGGGLYAPAANATGIAKLFKDWLYAPSGDQVVTISGLTIGEEYDARFYCDNLNMYASVPLLITATNGTEVDTLSTYDPFQVDGWHYLQYEYVATSTALVMDFSPSAASISTYELYGLTNQVVPEPTGLGIISLSLFLLRRSRTGG